MAGIGLVYWLNRFLPPSPGIWGILRSGYVADVLAGGLILCLVNLFLLLARRPPLRTPLAVSLFLLGCGLFWEYITPLYRPDAVSDPFDLLAYWLGGMGLLLYFRRTQPDQYTPSRHSE